MAAFTELMEDAWDREKMERIELTRESDDTYRHGQLFRHNVKKCSKSRAIIIFCIIATVYVDDTAVPFTSRDQLRKGLAIIQQLFKDLGMEMHVGNTIEKANKETGESETKMKDSKTECIFFANVPLNAASQRTTDFY